MSKLLGRRMDSDKEYDGPRRPLALNAALTDLCGA